jgi:triacylglycerol lipase
MPMQRRPHPSETVSGLRPPLNGFPFFAHADRFPFQSEAVACSATNAWWLADASFLVYGTAAFIEEALRNSPLPSQSFRLDWLGTRDDNRGLILSNDATLVVVFRGTRLQVHTLFDVAEVVLIDEDDWRIDSQFLPTVCQAGGRAHRGFLAAYADIRDRLDAVVRARRPGQALWLTGHSLGGALATLAAAHLDEPTIQGIYTYGCPRVGDAAFVSVLPRQSHYRFVHRDDWVSTVPPDLLGYVHGGTLWHLPGDGPRRFWDDLLSGVGSLATAVNSLASRLRLDSDQLPFKIAGLADHAPIYYATLLWNILLDSEPSRPQRPRP